MSSALKQRVRRNTSAGRQPDERDIKFKPRRAACELAGGAMHVGAIRVGLHPRTVRRAFWWGQPAAARACGSGADRGDARGCMDLSSESRELVCSSSTAHAYTSRNLKKQPTAANGPRLAELGADLVRRRGGPRLLHPELKLNLRHVHRGRGECLGAVAVQHKP